MSIKHFCDLCNEELTVDYNKDNLDESIIVHGVDVEVKIYIILPDNSYEVCRDCLFEIIDKLDRKEYPVREKDES